MGRFDNDEFIDIKGFEGKYGINRNGEIISYKRYRKPKTSLINGWIGKRGYRVVMLIKTNRLDQKKFMVHQLVAETFLKKENESLVINHKDGNKLNNQLENLEYVSQLKNMQHAFENNLVRRKTKLTYETMELIRAFYASKTFTQKQMAENFNVSTGLINDIIQLKTGNKDGRNHKNDD
jgi:predicted XRE-type DNA-binding protein